MWDSAFKRFGHKNYTIVMTTSDGNFLYDIEISDEMVGSYKIRRNTTKTKVLEWLEIPK